MLSFVAGLSARVGWLLFATMFPSRREGNVGAATRALQSDGSTYRTQSFRLGRRRMFSILVLVAALGALSYEMVEDNFVNLIYAHIFGWRTLLVAFLAAGAVIVPLSVLLVVFAPVLFQSYFAWVQRLGALVLLLVGGGWLVSSLLAQEGPPEEVREAEAHAKKGGRKLVLATQLVAIEQVEIVAVLLPLGITGHGTEAVLAGGTAVGVALVVALTLRERFSKLVQGRFRLLKQVSGVALIVLGAVLLIF